MIQWKRVRESCLPTASAPLRFSSWPNRLWFPIFPHYLIMTSLWRLRKKLKSFLLKIPFNPTNSSCSARKPKLIRYNFEKKSSQMVFSLAQFEILVCQSTHWTLLNISPWPCIDHSSYGALNWFYWLDEPQHFRTTTNLSFQQDNFAPVCLQVWRR